MPTITIDNLAEQLNRAWTLYEKEFQKVARVGMETEMHASRFACDHSKTFPNVDITDIVQPYQCDFTPIGQLNFDEITLTLEHGKVDLLFECNEMDAWFETWKNDWDERGIARTGYKFPRWVINTQVMDKFAEEMEDISWNGVRAAPTAGTAGASLDTFTGFHKILDDGVTAGSITPIATGPILPATIVAQVENMVDQLELPYRNKTMDIVMSPSMADAYYRNYRARFGYEVGNMGNENRSLRVDGRKARTIKTLAGLEGSQRIIITPKGNMVYGVRRGKPSMPRFRFQEFDRNLKCFSEFSRVYGFKSHFNLFINDQA